MEDARHRARLVRLAVFDVDGVLTDGSLHYTASGEETKVFNVLDGQGMKLLQESGVELAVITSRRSGAVERRMRDLGIDHLFQGVHDKLSVFEDLVKRMGVDAQAAAFMGDDLVDLAVMRRCGLAVSVPDAAAIVREHAHYVTRAGGGRGAVREACEFIMVAQDTLNAALQRYLR
jgi:3-deoxy-D-manno-octulosonate 8-phosphate phosphatase (KDO 8-P phosphatase)